jgi:transcriptional regulator with XRE-family HTH domain
MVYSKVVKYCKDNNLSISAFEQKCNLPNGLVGKWRDIKCEPSIPTLQKISSATGISIEKWLAESE